MYFLPGDEMINGADRSPVFLSCDARAAYPSPDDAHSAGAADAPNRDRHRFKRAFHAEHLN
jgi:hypothetical protein